MRICLTSTQFPSEGKGGIPRQRQILANALARMGHEVHVIFQGRRSETYSQKNLVYHSVPSIGYALPFLNHSPSVNERLTHSLAIEEQIRVLNQERPLDILDTPLWGLEGFIPIYSGSVPAVLWLQTSFAQMVSLEGRSLQGDDTSVVSLEKECLRRAKGIIADSQTVLADFEGLYQLPGLAERSRVVRLGIPDLRSMPEKVQNDRGTVEAILVGRLEKRKGTPYLFEILPELLRNEKSLRVRFIGADNSRWDGFYAQFHQSYPEYFHSRWPGFRNRVIFEGEVSDQRLIEAYNQADMLLVPSLYESFGIIYLEGMRAKLPIVTFALGAAREIFPQGENNGALLACAGDWDAFAAAIQSLVHDLVRRRQLGTLGREKFLSSFLDQRMAEETVNYYREVSNPGFMPQSPKPRRIFQVMEALDVGDAVSTIALKNAKLLSDMNMGGAIISRQVHPQLPKENVYPVDQFNLDANAALIYHYWNYSNLENFIQNFSGPKAMHFHNITPPEFFSQESPGYETTSRGYEQLPKIINLFDLLIGDSAYNLEVCRPYLNSSKPSIVVPPVIETEEVWAKPYNADLLDELRGQKGVKFLFVGRIARNKRQDQLMKMFDGYYQSADKHACLYLVGSAQGDPQYWEELLALRMKLPSRDRIILTGKVNEECLYSYYRAADIFISASEHEGFCVPIVEAMALDIPVLAKAAAAVPETMGGAGVLVNEWENSQILMQVHQLMENFEYREKILAGQRENLKRYLPSFVKDKLAAVVHYLRTGEVQAAHFRRLDPA